MYLIKAEAMNELGQTAAGDRAGQHHPRRVSSATANPLSDGAVAGRGADAIFNERLFELTAEGKRRSDMIRAGTFVDARRFKSVDGGVQDPVPDPADADRFQPAA